jgi:hypothetical protein
MARVANPPLSRFDVFLVIAVLCPMCAKDFLGGHGMRRNRPGDPGQFEEMADIDVRS